MKTVHGNPDMFEWSKALGNETIFGFYFVPKNAACCSLSVACLHVRKVYWSMIGADEAHVSHQALRNQRRRLPDLCQMFHRQREDEYDVTCKLIFSYSCAYQCTTLNRIRNCSKEETFAVALVHISVYFGVCVYVSVIDDVKRSGCKSHVKWARIVHASGSFDSEPTNGVMQTNIRGSGLCLESDA